MNDHDPDVEAGNGRVVEVLGPDGSIVHLGGRRPVAIDLTGERPGVEWEEAPTDAAAPDDPPAGTAEDVTHGDELDATDVTATDAAAADTAATAATGATATGGPAPERATTEGPATDTAATASAGFEGPSTDAARDDRESSARIERDPATTTVSLPSSSGAAGGQPVATTDDGWPLPSDPDHHGTRHRRRLPLLVRIGGPVLAVVLLAALGAFYARSHTEESGDLARRVSHAERQYQSASESEVALTLARLAAIQGITDGNDDALAEAAELVESQSDQLDRVTDRLESLGIDNIFTEPMAALLASDQSYLDVTGQLVSQAQDDPDAAQESLNSNREFFQQRRQAHAELRDDFAAELTSLIESLDEERSRAGWIFPLLPTLLLLIGLGLAWRAWRSIVAPLRQVAQTLDWIAQGQFRVRSNVGGSDDVARVGRATDRVAERLGERFSTLADDARRGTQNRVIYEALEIADSEPATFAVVEQAMGLFAPELPAELLLLDPVGGNLSEVAASPTARSPGCPVTDPAGCFALRRGQTVVFDSSESINSCPMLRARDSGPISAVCIPMTFNSTALGVVHVTAPNHLPPDSRTRDQFIDLATQAATHIGTLRTLEVTRQQASTDGLTGLANRRVIEARVDQLLIQGVPFVLVLADLDRFKSINDRYGHEVGDRALQAFAGMLVDNVRGADVVGRLGGEEFIIIYPELSVAGSMEAIERLRLALADVSGEGDIPSFTASFGVTHSSVGRDFDEVVRVADAGLLMAKEQGRDRAIYATPDLAEQVFNGDRSTDG
ncbi:MAG: diguanylate cyclase [Microthrixaceae bacterium]